MALVRTAARKASGSGARKRTSKVARGRMAKAQVFRGSKEKTAGGLKRDALMRNKRNKIVSKRANAAGKMRYRQVEGWVDSLMEARRALHISGFVAINGASLQGKALYVKAMALYRERSTQVEGEKVVKETPEQTFPVIAVAAPGGA